MANGHQYDWSDAWLLLAIVYASTGGDATLERIIAAGDAIAHAIFTPDEWEGGLARLMAGGHVVETSGSFSPTEKVLRAYATRTSPRRAMSQEVQELAEWLRAAPRPTERPLPTTLPYAGLSMAAYQAAVDSYTGRVRRGEVS